MDKIKVLKFSAEWCNPCKNFEPIFDEFSKLPEYSNFIFEKIDIDKNTDLPTKYKVRSIPTVIILKGDKVLQRFSGVIKDKFKEILDITLKEEQDV